MSSICTNFRCFKVFQTSKTTAFRSLEKYKTEQTKRKIKVVFVFHKSLYNCGTNENLTTQRRPHSNPRAVTDK